MNSSKTKEFFDMRSREFKDLYYQYLDLCAASLKRTEILHNLAESMVTSFAFPATVANKVSSILLETFEDPTFTSYFCDLRAQATDGTPAESDATESHLYLSSLDFDRYNTYIKADPHITPQLKHLLLALMAVYRRNYHRSGWIRYDRKYIFYLAGLQALPTKEAEELANYLHQEYGLEMQVIGSKQPIPCFKFAWMFDQQQPGSHVNQFLDFGAFTPETIAKISSNEITPQKLD